MDLLARECTKSFGFLIGQNNAESSREARELRASRDDHVYRGNRLIACYLALQLIALASLRGSFIVENAPFTSDNQAKESDGADVCTVKRVCVVCSSSVAANGSSRSSHSLLRCSGCKKVYYCGQQHQAQHWPFHKVRVLNLV